MSSFFHSIRWRIQAWHGAILLGAITAFCVTAYFFAWDHQLRRVDRELQESERMLIRALIDSSIPGAHPGPPNPDQIFRLLTQGNVKLPPDVLARFSAPSYFSFRDVSGRILLQSANAPADFVPLPIPKTGLAEAIRTVGLRRESLHSTAEGISSVIGRDLTAENEEMNCLAGLLVAAGLGTWLLGLLGGWWFAGRALQPVAAISRAATRIADGNLTERIETTGKDSELDQLAHVLNQTFERLNYAFERQKQFTADASHELRTPVTILLAETQRILKRDRTTAEYKDAVRTCQNTAERMRHLIEDLLVMARQEASGTPESRQTCDLADTLRNTSAQLQPLANARGIFQETHLTPALCRADPASLSILAANLVGNALQHHRTGSDSFVLITTGYEDGNVFFSVSDNGPGIPPEDQSHIFERFYRVDKARTGSSGHTGLGLAIAKTIAHNHGGSITLRSQPGQGTTFTVSLPAA